MSETTPPNAPYENATTPDDQVATPPPNALPTPSASAPPLAARGDYGADNIQVLEGLEAVRKRPAMYIGDVGVRGLHHLVYEVVDNSIDEALAGYCDHIEVVIHRDNSISVADDGRGIPVAMHPTEGKPAVEVVMTVLHAGGKFDKDTYKVSGGLHGVGVSCVNALSDRLDVTVRRDEGVFKMAFERGDTADQLERVRDMTEGEETGTTVTFKPDTSIFLDTVYRFDTLAARMRELAYLNKGITITLTDEREDDPELGVETYHSEGGLAEFVDYLDETRESLLEDAISDRGRGRRRARRAGDALQHGLPGERALVRQQHQHARGRHPRLWLPPRADADAQGLRRQQRPAQEGQGQPRPATTSAKA